MSIASLNKSVPYFFRPVVTGLDVALAKSLAERFLVRISILAPTMIQIMDDTCKLHASVVCGGAGGSSSN